MRIFHKWLYIQPYKLTGCNCRHNWTADAGWGEGSKQDLNHHKCQAEGGQVPAESPQPGNAPRVEGKE